MPEDRRGARRIARHFAYYDPALLQRGRAVNSGPAGRGEQLVDAIECAEDGTGG